VHEDPEVTPWGVILGVWSAGALLVWWSRARARAAQPIDEALPECTIAELEPGRFRVRGHIVALESSPSAVDGAVCVYVERAEYESVGSHLVPLLREVGHGAISHPFYLEDDTGRLLVDPATTLIDCASAVGDGGLTAERRLRDGEEVSLTASFAPSAGELEEGEGPYRARSRQWRAVADVTGPPRLSHRTEHGMVRLPPDEISAFLGGAGGILLAAGSLLALAMLLTA
jgi:hypothetical protein